MPFKTFVVFIASDVEDIFFNLLVIVSRSNSCFMLYIREVETWRKLSNSCLISRSKEKVLN